MHQLREATPGFLSGDGCERKSRGAANRETREDPGNGAQMTRFALQARAVEEVLEDVVEVHADDGSNGYAQRA